MGGAVTIYVFNAAGQRVSTWLGATQLEGTYYWGARPVAFYSGGSTHFEHQDWLGTERMRTTYNGGVEGSFFSLPFGDGQATTGLDENMYHFATLDHDVVSDTDHAQFRQYSNAEGRWLSPDPYQGSYQWRNPQSFNRYTYAGNNPLSAADPSGLDPTGSDCSNSGTDDETDCAINDGNDGVYVDSYMGYNASYPQNIWVPCDAPGGQNFHLGNNKNCPNKRDHLITPGQSAGYATYQFDLTADRYLARDALSSRSVTGSNNTKTTTANTGIEA
jgi:RHS repeat-associated protein